MNEKLIKTLVTIVAIFIILIVIIFGISSCTNKKKTFNDLEDLMISTTKDYYQSNKDRLPKIDNKKVLSLKDIISIGKLKEPSKYLKNENITCDGNVTVYNNNGNYLYTPYLKCGKEYETILLKDKIIKDNLTDKGVGLYNVNGTYIMKGEVQNNYLSFNDKIFRIMRVNEDGTIRVIQNEEYKQATWDNRYNPDEELNSGINEYMYNNINSRIKDTVEKYYNDESVWPKSSKAYISSQNLCIGKRSSDDTTKDGQTECSKKLSNQQFGLLSVYEYLQASLDKNCSYTESSSCSNYNWYTRLKDVWTLTASSESSDKVYRINQVAMLASADSMYGVNIVINLVGDVTYSTGDGSKDNPYILK